MSSSVPCQYRLAACLSAPRPRVSVPSIDQDADYVVAFTRTQSDGYDGLHEPRGSPCIDRQRAVKQAPPGLRPSS
jgi:hypothetical protein